MPEPLRWQPVSAWASIAPPGRGGAPGEAGIRIEPVAATHVLSIVARADGRGDLARVVADGLDATLPPPGRLMEGRDGDLVWSGPDHWLAITREAMPAELRRDLESVAAVTDQSSARALLHVSGACARDALTKGFAIDLDPTVFEPGCTAVTSVAHISVQIWQREAGRYTIAVPRSFAASFWAWLAGAAAAYGYEVVTAASFSRKREKGGTFNNRACSRAPTR